MNSIIRRYLALLLSVATIISLVISPVSAATHNVHQSRRIAAISDFPTSYRVGLSRIKSIYPNAQFVYYDVDLDWYKDVLTTKNEMRYGLNLVPSSSPSSWKSTDAKSYDPTTDTYTQVEPGWNQASVELVEYYMDPRNFFNATDIFQFLDLSFNGSETVEGVAGILKGSFMAKKQIVNPDGKSVSYAEALYQIGKEVGVSPYLLACRIRQEQGSGKSSLISGKYNKVPGYYNYFNIAASGSTTEEIITNGLNYAKKQGWNTPYKSIYGGAKALAKNYVGSGKNCLYLQHFNMTASNNTVNYSIYMANTLAPYQENKMMSKSLTNKKANYTFIIPVYDNMPKNPCDLPDGKGNNSYVLKKLVLNGGEVDIGKFSSNKYQYQATVNDLSLLSIKATTYYKTSKISINGVEIDMNGSKVVEKALMLDKGFNDCVITVTAESGVCRDYVIKIINDDGEPHYRGLKSQFHNDKVLIRAGQTVSNLKSDIETLYCSVLVTDTDGKIKDNDAICVSGDILVIKTGDNQMVYSAPIVIDGDVNCDGYLTDADSELIKSHILETYTLSLQEQTFADMDGDKEITIKDLGLIKVLLGSKSNSSGKNISVAVNVPDNIFYGKDINVSVKSSSGAYVAEGYLTYNEGKISTIDAENSGKIHFIVDGEKLTFDIGGSAIAFQPIVRSGPVDFDIEIVSAYDYVTGQNIEVKTGNKSARIENYEIDVSVQLNKSPTEGYKDYHAATLTIKNLSNRNIDDVTVDLGQYFVNDNQKQVFEIPKLKSGKSKSIELYAIEGLKSDRYDSEITIQYQDAAQKEETITSPVSLEILNHDHENKWQFNESQHYTNCKVCKEEKKENHIYFEETNGQYKCLICGYIKTLSATISITGTSCTNNPLEFTPSIKINDQSVNISDLNVDWYIDSKKVSNQVVLSTKFQSVGNRTIDCVIRNDEGLLITESIDLYVAQAKTSSANDILISNVTCHSISLKQHVGYEYRLNGGKWQDESIFSNLTTGTEYTVYQRQKNQPWLITSVKVIPNHRMMSCVDQHGTCGSNISKSGTCIFCKSDIVRTLPDTTRGHVFAHYVITTKATCKDPSVETAPCAYGCGIENQRKLDDKQSHSFTNYVYDNNSSCVSGGTNTAFCDYNCGTSDIVQANKDGNGHVYVYTANDNATVETSMTETGICSYCGQTNTRTIDGTRRKYLTEIHVEISTATTQTAGLPTVTTSTTDVVDVCTTWQNSAGMAFDGNAQDVVIQNDETYTLTTLTLVADNAHAFHDTVVLYVNGQQFGGIGQVEENTVVFKDVGQFKF